MKEKNKNVKKTSNTKVTPKKTIKKVTKKVTNKPVEKETKKKVTTKPVKKVVSKSAVKKNNKVVKKVKPKKKIIKEDLEKTLVIDKNIVEEEKTIEDSLEKTIIFDPSTQKNLKDVVNNLEEENVILEDKVIKRSKNKRIIVWILTALIFITIIMTSVYVIDAIREDSLNKQTMNSNILLKVKNRRSKNKNNKIDNQIKGKEEYDHISTISLKEFEDKVLANEDMTILIFRENCLGCITFEPILESVLANQNKIVYRINISQMTNESIETFRKYYYFTETPRMFSITNGVVTSELIGAKTDEVLADWIANNVK